MIYYAYVLTKKMSTPCNCSIILELAQIYKDKFYK